jgi:hypothetical protein
MRDLTTEHDLSLGCGSELLRDFRHPFAAVPVVGFNILQVSDCVLIDHSRLARPDHALAGKRRDADVVIAPSRELSVAPLWPHTVQRRNPAITHRSTLLDNDPLAAEFGQERISVDRVCKANQM